MVELLKKRAVKAIGLSALVLASAVSTKANAAEWQKVLECDGGAAVLDIRERRSVELVDYQLVIRNPDIISYLASEGLEAMNASGEVVIPFAAYREQEVLTRYVYNSRLLTPVIETVRRLNGGKTLSFDIYRAESSTGSLWLQRERIGGWTFWHCRNEAGN